MAHYYAQRKSVTNGVPQTPNNRYGTKREMQRQFHLYCANALDGEDFVNDVDDIEWGTLENGAQERVCFVKETQPESTSEPEST